MKIIRSNPWGFGIHSPFVYQLVTKVIFGKTDLSSAYFSLPGEIKSLNKRRIYQIIRLIRFFHPDEIIFTNVDESIKRIIRDKFRDDNVQKAEKYRASGFYQKFFVGCDPSDPVKQIGEGSVLYFPDLKAMGCKDLFLTLQNDPQITVTIEVNHTGLVIANRNYQKQNFYIRRWFCL